MDISKYQGFFHDGTLLEFNHQGTSIEVSMISADIIPEHMLEDMPPLDDKNIKGKLYIEGVKEITINRKPFTGILKKTHDNGEILDFEVYDHNVILGIEWKNYPPKPRDSDFSFINITAEKIRWENVLDLPTD